MIGQRTIIVDLDGTICHQAFPHIGHPLDGALKSLRLLTESRWKIVVGTCRNNPVLYRYPEDRNQNLRLVRVFIEKCGLPNLYVDDGRMGKLIAKWQIDDRGIPFNGNWEEVLETYFSNRRAFNRRHGNAETIAIGVENCIVDGSGSLVAKTKEAFDYLLKKGYRIVLTTVLSNRVVQDSDKRRQKDITKLRKRLSKCNLRYHWLDEGVLGKPVADWYVESNMIPFRGAWSQVTDVIMGKRKLNDFRKDWDSE